MDFRDIEEAKKCIHDSLINSFQSDTDRERALLAIRAVLCGELGINEHQVIYRIRELNAGVTIAGVGHDRGDGVYEMDVDSYFLYNAPAVVIISAIAHEYGHIKQMLRSKRGEKVKSGIIVDQDEFYTASKWQKLGATMKYNSSRDEKSANDFATKKLLEWIKEIEKSTGNMQLLTRKSVLSEKIENDFLYYINKVGAGAWKLLSLLMNIKDEVTRELEMSTDVPTLLYNLNEEKQIKNNHQARTLANIKIKAYLKESAGKFNEKTLLKTRIEKIVDASRAMRVIYAKKLELSPQELSFVFVSNGETKPYFIYTRDYNSNAPIYGYINYPKERVETISSVGEFIKDLDEILNEALKHKLNMELSNEG